MQPFNETADSSAGSFTRGVHGFAPEYKDVRKCPQNLSQFYFYFPAEFYSKADVFFWTNINIKYKRSLINHDTAGESFRWCKGECHSITHKGKRTHVTSGAVVSLLTFFRHAKRAAAKGLEATSDSCS